MTCIYDKGLHVPVVGVNSLKTGGPLVDKAVAVEESWIGRAILKLVEVKKIVVEGAGATGFAGIMAGLLPELKGKKVVSILCGTNIDSFVLQFCLDRGLAIEQRLIKFGVDCSDRIGGLDRLLKCIADIGVNVQKVSKELAWIKDDVFKNRFYFICETRGAEEFLQALQKKYNSTVPN